MIVITDERCLKYAAVGHPERPARVARSIEKLRAQTEVAVEWSAPMTVPPELLLLAHTPDHVERVRRAAYDFDADTPAYPDIYEHAVRSVGGALQALELARQGQAAFSLLRPPGHHATRNQAMGFCYFNSMAIAVLKALQADSLRVAVFDFDVHHGNGTEAILLNQPHAAYFSVHQYPAYPGTGTANRGDNAFNYPVPPYAPREEYRAALGRAWQDLLKFKPMLVGISAGFDAYRRDPIAQSPLEVEDYHWLGQLVRESGLPAFSILEGGYSDELPELILAYLKGLERS